MQVPVPSAPRRPLVRSAARRVLGAALLVGAVLATAPAAQADVLELKDGRFVEGLIVPDTHPELGKGVYVVSRFGPTFVPEAQIAARREGTPVDQQIEAYLARLEPKDVPSRLRLAEWMLGLGRQEEGRALLHEILGWQPENPDAHKLLGHVRYRGRWITPDEAQRARGLVKRGDRWYTPQEWENLATADKRKAEEAERLAAARARQAALNEAVRLALSPDPAVRARGRARLEAMGSEREYDAGKIRTLLAGIDDYLQTLDDLRRKAAGVGGAVGVKGGGMVMGEIRATFSKLKRPIPVFQTNLAAGPVGANAPVSIQLPELEVIRVNTTMGIPALIDD